MHLFGRKVKLTIISTEKVTKTFTSEDGFSIEFDLEFGKRATGVIKIYNVLKSTIDLCNPKDPNTKKVQYPTVELYAGYGEDENRLTSASIISHEYKKSGVDSFLEIKIGATVSMLQNNYVIDTFENFPVNSILRSVFGKAGITNYEINLPSDKIIPKIAFNGTLQDALVAITKVIDSVFYEKNGKIIFESKDINSKRQLEYVLLSPSSGLVGYPEESKGKLKVKSLLDSKLSTGEVFKLELLNDVNKYNGFYKILDGKHHGGNKIDSFFTEFECKKE